MALVKEYLDLTKKYKADYGEKTILLMQVGSFLEVYALINPDGTYTGSNIVEFAKINEMVIAEKNTCVGNLKVAMAGMGVAYVDKYIQKLQEHDYTIVIYKQDINGKNTTRSLAEIISPGTFFPAETAQLSNNMMCIWLHKSSSTKLMPSQVTLGIANIDIYTGKTSLFQFAANYDHNPATYDELERYISAYRPSECLFVANMPERLINDIIGFVGLEQTKIHKIDLSEGLCQGLCPYNPDKGQSPCDPDKGPSPYNPDPNKLADPDYKRNCKGQSPYNPKLAGPDYKRNCMVTFAKNAEKQIYQTEILKKFFPHLSSFYEMFPTHHIALQAFCFLLDFVYQHSPNLVKKLSEPVFENYTDKLMLANHSLHQLNIIDDMRHTGRYRSVGSLLNNCVTTMGKRHFLYHLHYPITHEPTLQASYDITEHLLSCGELNIRQQLATITDLEKFSRKVVTRKITPINLVALVADLAAIQTLYTDAVLTAYLHQQNIQAKSEIQAHCAEISADITRVFCLAECQGEITETTYIINQGISPLIDELRSTSFTGKAKLEAICNFLSGLIQRYEKTAVAKDYVKIHETAKSDALLIATTRRIGLLKEAIKAEKKSAVNLTFHTDETFIFDLTSLEYDNNGGSKNDKVITSRQIKEITRANETAREKLVREMQLFFQNYMGEFMKFDTPLQAIIKYTTEMDMLQCKCFIANKYNYCKPQIQQAHAQAGQAQSQAQAAAQAGQAQAQAQAAGQAQAQAGQAQTENSFLSFTDIRHPLIEYLQSNELYVTNDLSMSASGILLYGTNAVGKTSFIKSVGIAIIMAQAGLYVPCSTFVYKPYRTIFTRILGNDNLFKGLSTFAVEMTELRAILMLADAHSLVLGDELCSGTESDSALSIFTAGLEILHEKNSTFLFATHFHEITKYEEITALPRLKMLHMAVHYNKENNALVYDRKLREGPGESMYGLEVCKSLNLPDAFLQRAHDIRMKYRPERQNILSLSPTHYNAKKLVGNCEICKKHKASEVHHLQHQKNASTKNDYIQTFHKNHVANLLNICEDCHQKIHKSGQQHKVVKTTAGYKLQPV